MSINPKHIFPGATVYEHGNWGYPFRGSHRRLAPQIVECVHITGVSALSSALAEIKYSARAGSGASFPFCVNRNGTVVQAYDPFECAPWTNGDIREPDLTNPIIKKIASQNFYNPNEYCLLAIEHVGYESGPGVPAPITDAQKRTTANIIAWARPIAEREYGWKLPLDRITLIGHAQINSVTRSGCPTRNHDLNRIKDTIIGYAGGAAAREINMHIRPKDELWTIRKNAPLWIDGPDPTYNGTEGSWTHEPDFRHPGTPDGKADVTIGEEWRKDDDGNWGSGVWRMFAWRPGTPDHTSVCWVYRSDMTPLRVGGGAFPELIEKVRFGTVYDPVHDKIVSTPISGGYTKEQVDAAASKAADAVAAAAKAAADKY